MIKEILQETTTPINAMLVKLEAILARQVLAITGRQMSPLLVLFLTPLALFLICPAPLPILSTFPALS